MINLFENTKNNIVIHCNSYEYDFGKLNKKQEKAFFDIMNFVKRVVSKTNSTNFASMVYND